MAGFGATPALLATLALLAALAWPGAAGAQVPPYGTNDFGGFRNVLPPGTNGLVNATQLGLYELTKARPPHNDDQLAMYSDLTTAAPGIQPAQIGNYFKDATFGVPVGDVGPSESPEPGVTIVRDQQFGVPHIYGDTRPALMFGIGYATAEDRLFFIDALRHVGQGDLASFAGGANVSMDQSVWAMEPYTPQDLTAQVQHIAAGPDGQQILSDATNYVAGINAYITAAKNPLNLATKMPAEYTVLGLTPQPFALDDLVSIAALVGGIFGNGGGNQLANAVLYQQMAKRFGHERTNAAGSPEFVKSAAKKQKQNRKATGHRQPRPQADRSGYATFLSFVDPTDPEAPTTVRGRSFPYQTLARPSAKSLSRLAMPDPGSVRYVNHVVGGAAPAGGASDSARVAHRAAGARATPIGTGLGPAGNAGPGLLAFPQDMSNALLISAKHSASGHPLA
ncbi:MAG: penicillin acylase family protein, partial [Actinomycetota bacterium]|nr:penicillin acylase family protein [Actinomycetota bacterium]